MDIDDTVVRLKSTNIGHDFDTAWQLYRSLVMVGDREYLLMPAMPMLKILTARCGKTAVPYRFTRRRFLSYVSTSSLPGFLECFDRDVVSP
jgi:hypothetical protein